MGYVPPSSSYSPLLLSHQTGLSVTASTANTFYTIGSSISVPRNGIAVISMMGHVNAGNGYIQLQLTRGSNTYSYGNTNFSLFSDSASTSSSSSSAYIGSTSSVPQFTQIINYGTLSSTYTIYARYLKSNIFVLPLNSGDSLQFYAANNTAGDITYVDDVLVMLI
ncbi:MAG: hypothetical protein QXE05_10860 [Nitrososphaeria archaeon]